MCKEESMLMSGYTKLTIKDKFNEETREAIDHGAMLQRIRTERFISQQNMALKLGFSAARLSRIEAGKAHFHMSTILLCAKVLGLKPIDLLPGDSPWQEFFTGLEWTNQPASGN
jgi:DNA-binding XRE family transcriptional regulator